jgi:UDP-glucose 4-epimerase
VASSEKIQKELGWKAENSSLENILKTAWAWHESHPKGWKE